MQVVAKQALPYVRCVGDSWPLTLERASFEYLALTAQRGLCPDRVPEVFHFNKEKALIGEDGNGVGWDWRGGDGRGECDCFVVLFAHFLFLLLRLYFCLSLHSSIYLTFLPYSSSILSALLPPSVHFPSISFLSSTSTYSYLFITPNTVQSSNTLFLYLISLFYTSFNPFSFLLFSSYPVMRFIEEPNQILRYALMKGLKFSTFAPHTGSYMAQTLFHSSALALDGGRLVYAARDI